MLQHVLLIGICSLLCSCWLVAFASKLKRVSRSRASSHEFPWVVAIRAYYGPFYLNTTKEVVCSGAIFDHQGTILTTRECVSERFVDTNAQELPVEKLLQEVFIQWQGDNPANMMSEERIFGAQISHRIAYHRSDDVLSDGVLIFLSTYENPPIPPGNHRIRPIGLSQLLYYLPQDGVLAGYGITPVMDSDGQMSFTEFGLLKQLNMTMIGKQSLTWSEPRRQYQTEFIEQYIPGQMAYFAAHETVVAPPNAVQYDANRPLISSVCQGDIGGPYMIREQHTESFSLLGVLKYYSTHDTLCASGMDQNIFFDVRHIVSWVEWVIAERIRNGYRPRLNITDG